MGFDDIKTKVEKAAGNVDDEVKEKYDEAKDKIGDMTDNIDDAAHHKGGETEGRSEQFRQDQSREAGSDESNDPSYATPDDPSFTGVDNEEYGAPGRSTSASDLDDNPLEDDL